MDIANIVELVNQYGIPIVVAVGMGYFIFYIWKFVTNNILPSLDKALGTLIGLIDRVRMLDNDMIRLDQKIHTIIAVGIHKVPYGTTLRYRCRCVRTPAGGGRSAAVLPRTNNRSRGARPKSKSPAGAVSPLSA